jgi:hypothetical protein
MKRINELCEKYETSKYQANKIQIRFNSLRSENIFLANTAHPSLDLAYASRINVSY